MNKKFFVVFVFVFSMFFTSCKTQNIEDRDTLFQVNLLQSLMQGYYDGNVTIKELKKNGDIGIGTFNGVNGELIELNGVVYQALSDGSINIPPDNTQIPYATVSFFDADIKLEFTDIISFNDLIKRIDSYIQQELRNDFCLIKVYGTFKTIYVRSELKQERPYKPLVEALKTDQREFHYQNIAGTIVALYCPNFMGQLNSPGYHLHFISDDRTKGGHVFDLSVDKISVEIDKTTHFKMVLSDDKEFQNIDLSKDMISDMNKVEKGK